MVFNENLTPFRWEHAVPYLEEMPLQRRKFYYEEKNYYEKNLLGEGYFLMKKIY